ncbi:Uncharacterised protein [Mycobacteroides abscessus subsp. massiliense]|nr:Uncharacterised protein [Mycobacteroides abscessus subsp. massiliense]
MVAERFFICRMTGAGRIISNQLFMSVLFLNNYRLIKDIRMFAQFRFNRSQFDAEAADFHLTVNPAGIFYISVRQPSGQITCLVKFFSFTKRIINK